MLAKEISKNDSVSLAQVRSRFSELVQEVKAGAEKIITKDGEPYVALQWRTTEGRTQGGMLTAIAKSLEDQLLDPPHRGARRAGRA